MRKKSLYHCTVDSTGRILQVARRKLQHRAYNEPVVPRLCACPSVAECFAARLFPPYKPVYVYRTMKQVKGITPTGVWDAAITRERWLIPPMRLERFAEIPWDIVDAAQVAVRLYHQATRKKSSWELRLMQLLEATEVLGAYRADFVDRRRLALVKRFCTQHGLPTEHASRYILGI